MKTSTVFTSTIAPELITWLDRKARSEKKTRRAVLEEAIRRYQREITRDHLREGFARAARDSGMLDLAEWGMNDYSDMVSRL